MPADITPDELRKKFTDKDEFILLDVREQHEFDSSRIPGSVLIPLGRLADSLHHLKRDCEIVVHCRSGARSARAAELLRKAGFKKVANLKGGIVAWEKS